MTGIGGLPTGFAIGHETLDKTVQLAEPKRKGGEPQDVAITFDALHLLVSQARSVPGKSALSPMVRISGWELRALVEDARAALPPRSEEP